VTSLLDGEATREAVTDFLTKEIPSRLSAETPFLVYFAGHGVAEGEDGSKGPQGYLILQDAELGKPETWLSMDVFRAALEALACRHLLVVLDCCYAGAFRWATASRSILLVGQSTLYKSVYDRYLEGEAWQALTSASAAQHAADAATGLPNLRSVNADGHSPFAAALIEGLGGAADYSTTEFPADGVITATELYQYVSTCLLPSPDAPTVQTPGIWPLRPGNDGEFAFLNPKVPLKVAPDPPLDDSNNPWLGLEAYTAANKDLFFGREEAAAELVARVTAKAKSGRLVAVVGPSGAGKSSLIGGGLEPALGAEKWTVVRSARLAGDPNVALEAAAKKLYAAPKGHRQLLVFDQFEELFTQCPDEGARARFLAAVRELVDGHGGPTVVVTLRSDFEARAADDASLREIWAAARYQVPQFSGDELRQVILGPAQVKAVYYDPGKVADDLFDEVSQTPGALPLLAFALAELYRQAQVRRRKSGAADRGLTTADYEAIGGVVGALNRRATQLYDEASSDEQQAIRRVFLRLVSQEGAALTRRRVERAELHFGDGEDAEQQCVDSVIGRYVDAGLLVIDGDSVEPAHDALVAQWQQLHDWLKESDSQALIRAAWRAADDWKTNSSAAGYLWNADPRLPQLAAAHRAGELNATERAFETASTRRRKSKRRRLGATVVAVMAVLVAATVVALLQRSQAIHQRDAATSRAFAAEAVQALTSAPKTALADSIQAVRASTTREAEEALQRALLANPLATTVLAAKKFGDPNLTLEFNDNGRLLLLIQDWALRVLRSTDGKPVEPAIPGVTHALFGPGARVLAASPDTVRLIGPGQPSDVRHMPAGDGVAAVGFSGTVPLALVAGHGAAEVLDVSSGTTVHLRGRWTQAKDAVFSKKGNRVLEDTGRRSIVWSTKTGQLLATLPDAGGRGSVLSPDGKLAASPAGLWSVDTHRRIATFPLAAQMSFSPNARELVVVDYRGNAIVYRTRDGKVFAELPNFGNAFSGNEAPDWLPDAAFSDDGRLVAVTDQDEHARVWELATDQQVASVFVGWADALAFSPHGGFLAAMTWDGDVLVTRAPASLGIETGFFDPSNDGHSWAPVVGPDGRYVVAPAAGTAGMWSLAGKRLRLFPPPSRYPHDAEVDELAQSGDGRVIAFAAADFPRPPGSAWTALWRVGSRAPFLRLPTARSPIMLDRRGSIVAFDGKAWDTSTGARLHRLDGIIALSPDGRLALVPRHRTPAIVSVPSGTTVAVLPGFGSLAATDLRAAFSQDGTRLLTFSDKFVRLTSADKVDFALWDTGNGTLIRHLGKTGETADWENDLENRFAFGNRGRLVFALFSDRAATFDAADGSEVDSTPGSFDAISPDGRWAAVANTDGTVGVVDLQTGSRVAIPTDTATKLTYVTFAKPDVIVATDANGNLHVLPCVICAPENELLRRARTTLARISRFHPRHPTPAVIFD
jgi:WD40 repeat protein